MNQKNSKIACLSLSGGMDSSTLLLHLLKENYQVQAVSFLYGQKQKAEIECAKKLTQYLREKGLPVCHQIIEINGLGELLFSALTDEKISIPQGEYTKENMLATVVPNRNKIFISILQSIALSLALKYDSTALVAFGMHAGDFHVYPDCRAEFVAADYQAFLEGNWQAEKVKNYLPYLALNKQGVLEDGILSCQNLNLDFNEVYKRTLTSYQPNAAGISDYKTASSVQRINAFIGIGRVDPIEYADESGIVEWQTVVDYVISSQK